MQDRLGLAKVKYERAHSIQKPAKERKRKSFHAGSEIMSDPTSDMLDRRYETPFPSSPLTASGFSKEFPRPSRTHTYSFQPESTHSNGIATRKRTRSDSTTEGPSKIARTSSWKRSHQLPESSPSGGFRAAPKFHGRSASFAPGSGTASHEFQLPPFPSRLDKDDDPDLPSNNIPIISSSMASSSPPRTPPPHHATLPRNEKGTLKGEDGADLLLFLANSPTPARNLDRVFLPSTPPSQHAALNTLSQTPQFNFADFVNVTPSPAQRTWGGRTPGGAAVKTPLATKEMRKKLNFDNLAPPTSGSPAKSRDKDSKPVLQLGEELRP